MGRVVAVVLLATLVACGDDGGATTLRVFAASSLTDAFGEIEAAFEAAHPDVDVVLNLAASSTLREQILAGAPADVFASADPAYVDDVEAAGAPVDFATNQLVMVVPSGNPAGVGGLDDFARDGLLIGLCAAEVPCGRLAREALAAAGVEASLDTEEPDARSLLGKVQTGELDAAIVYRTDVLRTDGVVGFELPPSIDVRATYRIVAVTDGRPATEFVAFVTGPRGQAILAGAGFAPP